jgi:hypothetical protein
MASELGMIRIWGSSIKSDVELVSDAGGSSAC